eukprot:CAMPEP_0194490110 /NCGR_PEP_ID=MMETSP0253-20130528/9438_1 /TAXON_ID=2966 /ORGANISM="Noctiluca scintillans" /LENGTH=94 /DNA_ID=CAMNT_0039330695 /DNA_START=60 /DNA_END=341 /DNA_ORIENTATION=+
MDERRRSENAASFTSSCSTRIPMDILESGTPRRFWNCGLLSHASFDFTRHEGRLRACCAHRRQTSATPGTSMARVRLPSRRGLRSRVDTCVTLG